MFGHRFIILDTDEYVLKYMESNASQYSQEALASIQNRIRKQDAPTQDAPLQDAPPQDALAPGSERYV